MLKRAAVSLAASNWPGLVPPPVRPTQQVSCIGCQGERVCACVVCDAVRGVARLALCDRDVIASIVL